MQIDCIIRRKKKKDRLGFKEETGVQDQIRENQINDLL